MEESIIQEVSKVFGFSEEDTQTFMNNMDINTQAPPDYFMTLLQKLKQPTIVEFPRRPNNLPTIKYQSFFEDVEERMKAFQEKKEAQHKKAMENYASKLTAYESSPQTNNTITVNEGQFALNNEGKVKGNIPSGQYGYVKQNKRSPFIYKFLKIPTNELNEENIRKHLTEPLINCILQQDSLAEPYTCKLHKFYGRPVENGYEFIFKMEDLKGDSVREEFNRVLGADIEKNLEMLLKVYGPLLEVLQLLRTKYSFEHGDLHGDNIMFVKKPNLKEGTDLDVKMIDFGYSSIQIGGKTYGLVKNPYSDAYYLIDIAQFGGLPNNITNTLEHLLKNKEMDQLSLVFLDEYKKMKTMKGGKRIRTRKHKSRRRHTRKH